MAQILGTRKFEWQTRQPSCWALQGSHSVYSKEHRGPRCRLMHRQHTNRPCRRSLQHNRLQESVPRLMAVLPVAVQLPQLHNPTLRGSTLLRSQEQAQMKLDQALLGQALLDQALLDQALLFSQREHSWQMSSTRPR